MSELSSVGRIREIAETIRALPEIYLRFSPSDFAEAADQLLAEAVDLGAFGGHDHLGLREKIRFIKTSSGYPDDLTRQQDMWLVSIECLAPEITERYGPVVAIELALEPIADLIEAEAAKLAERTQPEAGEVEAGKKRKLQWLADALLLVRDYPDWSDAEVARRVGKDKSTLTRSEAYQAGARMARSQRGTKGDLHTGYVTTNPESGTRDVEALAPADAGQDDRSDRGQPIPDSNFFREYCHDCNEPMRVVQDKVGKNPICDDCLG